MVKLAIASYFGRLLEDEELIQENIDPIYLIAQDKHMEKKKCF